MTTERTAAPNRAQWTAASLRFRRLLTCRSPAVRAMSAMVVSPRDQAQSVDADLQLDVTHAGAAQASASAASMGREASETSVSPEQNNSKPSPVPGPSTDTAARRVGGAERLGDQRTDRLDRGRAGDDDVALDAVGRRARRSPASDQAAWVSDQASSARAT